MEHFCRWLSHCHLFPWASGFQVQPGAGDLCPFIGVCTTAGKGGLYWSDAAPLSAGEGRKGGGMNINCWGLSCGTLRCAPGPGALPVYLVLGGTWEMP